jgi:hypothetical protein
LFLWARWRAAESNRIAVEQAAAQRREAEQRAEEQRKQLEREQQQAASDKQAKDEQIVRQAGPTEGQKLGHALASIALLPGGSRGPGGGQTLQIFPDTKNVQIILHEVPPDYSKFMVVIHTPEGRMVMQQQINRKGASLTFSLPAEKLVAGDYIVHIDGFSSSGVENVNDYTLSVRRPK